MPGQLLKGLGSGPVCILTLYSKTKQMRFYQSLRGREQVVKSTNPWFRFPFHVILFQEASEAMLAK